MNKKILATIIILAVLAVLIAFLLMFIQGRKVTPRVNKVSPFAQQTASPSADGSSVQENAPVIDPDTVPTTADYKIKFEDLYGKALKGKSTISVNDNTFATEYAIEVEGITPAPAGTAYKVYLESYENVRVLLGELSVNESKVGTMNAKGGRPEANWSVMIAFKDESKKTEETVYRGVLEVN